jgi:hypothetical protein
VATVVSRLRKLTGAFETTRPRVSYTAAARVSESPTWRVSLPGVAVTAPSILLARERETAGWRPVAVGSLSSVQAAAITPSERARRTRGARARRRAGVAVVVRMGHAE